MYTYTWGKIGLAWKMLVSYVRTLVSLYSRGFKLNSIYAVLFTRGFNLRAIPLLTQQVTTVKKADETILNLRLLTKVN